MNGEKLVSIGFKDVYLINILSNSDHRGKLIKIYSYEFLSKNGIEFIPVEETILSSKKFTLRGLHYQNTLKQSKMITCICGHLQVVLANVDMKSESFGEWASFELKENEVLYVPGYYALGTLAMEESLLHIGYGEKFIANNSTGIKWDDPRLGIEWVKTEELLISDKDKLLPYLDK